MNPIGPGFFIFFQWDQVNLSYQSQAEPETDDEEAIEIISVLLTWLKATE